LIGFRAIRRARAGIIAAEADLLARLLEARTHRVREFSSFGDFVREVLQLSPRTARRRVRLHRALLEVTPLRRAFAEGGLSPCQVLTLAPVVDEGNAPFWIELAANLTVRELADRVREAGRGPPGVSWSGTEDFGPELDDANPGRNVTFAAPMSAAITWDMGVEAARRALGWDAPVYQAVEAILAEAEGAVAGRVVGEVRAKPPRASIPPGAENIARSAHDGRPARTGMSRSALPDDARSQQASPRHVRAIRQTLALLDRELVALDETIGDSEPADRGIDLIERLRVLQIADRPLRLLEARLLRDLNASGALRAIGFENLAAFAERFLGLSERAVRGLLAECYLFDDEPLLARAFEAGRIGVGAAFLIRRVMLSRTLRAWIRRAEQVTHLQLAREVRLVERIWECAPDVAARFAGPLPQPGLEDALAGLAHAEGGPRPERDADPARDPRALTRLGARLDAYVLDTDADDPSGAAGGSPGNARQTLAAGRAERMTTISFWAPASVLESWDSALDRIRARWGPLPAWAAAVLLVECALREWSRVDPSRRPREAAILERDDYRCQAPGCSFRRNLEVHHIAFRSRGGSEDPANKITLCHAHHRRGIHGGTVHVSGRAPGELTWELGPLRYEGQRYVECGSRRRADRSGDALDQHLDPDGGQNETHDSRDHVHPVLPQEGHHAPSG
jgi:hypothetical protein